ncbi:MAG: hypothetical protein ACWA5U_02980 [bacterium]
MRHFAIKMIITLFFVLGLSACSASLAPNYNKVVVDGLISHSESLMTLFATIAGGTQTKTFPQRAPNYARLIGQLDALTIHARARPVPNKKLLNTVNQYLQDRDQQPFMVMSDIPSVGALEKINQVLLKMRDTDKKQGLTAFEVAAFKGIVVIHLDQALTYENFLQR